MDKLRICHISESTSGGVLTHLKQLAKNLDPEKYDQTFILSSLKNPVLKNNTDFYKHELYIVDMRRNIHPIQDLISLWKVYHILKRNKYDIIHCHSSKAGVIGRVASQITGSAATVYTPHAFSFHPHQHRFKNSLFKLIERLMAGFTDKIICVSEGEKLIAKEAHISKENKLIVIKNGVNLPQYKPYQHSFGNDKIGRIGFVGRLSKQKNPKLLLDALANLEDLEIKAFIMGNGDLKQELVEHAKKLNIEHKLSFLGEVDNVSEVLQSCCVYVCTSLWESMPYSILEAISVGVPVIAPDISGVRDIIIDYETGLLFEENNAIQLAERLSRLLTDDSLRYKLSCNAKEKLLTEYNLEKMITCHEELYEKLACGKVEGS